VQRPAIVPRLHFTGEALGLAARRRPYRQDPGLDLGFVTVDIGETLFQQVHGTELALLNQSCGFLDFRQVCHWNGCAFVEFPISLAASAN